MLGNGGSPLGCPHCGDIRFTRLAPPFCAASEVQCASCRNQFRLADLEPIWFYELALRPQPAALPRSGTG